MRSYMVKKNTKRVNSSTEKKRVEEEKQMEIMTPNSMAFKKLLNRMRLKDVAQNLWKYKLLTATDLKTEIREIFSSNFS